MLNDKKADIRAVRSGLIASFRAFPKCKIANCHCDTEKEWGKGCHCMCHFFSMDIVFGEGKWDLCDLSKSSEIGKPVRCKKHGGAS